MAEDGDVDAGLRGDIVNRGGKLVVLLGDVVIELLRRRCCERFAVDGQVD
jgi:hypothetical protein